MPFIKALFRSYFGVISVDDRFQLMLQPPLGVQFEAPEPPLFETEAKLDTFSSRFEPWHLGHRISLFSDDFHTSSSNSFPHSTQMNSYIGIHFSRALFGLLRR
jgi:hypothetical protein